MDETMQSGRKTLAKHTLLLAWGLALLVSQACRACGISPFPVETPTPQPTISLDELLFSDPETGARFRSLEGCIQAYIDDSWRPQVYHLSANYYELQWCRGAGTQPECRNIDPSKNFRDQHSIELFTKFYDLPEVTGLGVRALWAPEATGWKASFAFFEGSDREGGDGWGLTFSQYETATGWPDASLKLGDEYSYKVIETVIRYAPGIPIREDLAHFLAGPESMRDHAQAGIRALAQAVREGISAGQVLGCDWTPYEGRGIPPSCTPRPMTPAEQAGELAMAEAYFADQEGLLRDHYQEMYAAWMKAFPFDSCWP
jgi:hypothetical protein